MRFDCLERPIKKAFAIYGEALSSPIVAVCCIITPVSFAFALGCGFLFLQHETDVEYLFTPENSQTKKTQTKLKELFADIDNQYFDPDRYLDQSLVARAIITHKNRGQNIIEGPPAQEITDLDKFIEEIGVEGKKFASLCAKANDACLSHGWDLVTSGHPLTYPILVIPGAPKVYLHALLSEVKTDSSSIITQAGAVQLTYFLSDQDQSRTWEEKFVEDVLEKEFEHIAVTVWTYHSIEHELAENTVRIVPYFSITFTILISFSVTACTLLDPVKTKPWLGFCGVISAGLAIVTAFGILMYAGVPFVDIVAASPFLAVGIGVDDMFVMIAAWRKTKAYLGVPERMAEAFSEAAMSITITTVTDVLVIGIGAITPFPSVRIFCAYMGVTLLFDYIFQITFFAGCMSLTGHREAANRHAWTCMKVKPKPESGDNSKGCYAVCCMGGCSKDNASEDKKDVMMMQFFRDYFAKLINNTFTKVITILVWLAYLGVAIWGCININQGLELKYLAPDDSYVVPFYEAEAEYFTEYTYTVQVVVQEKIMSEDRANRVEAMLQEFENNEYFHGLELTQSWLREYEAFANNNNYTIDYNNIYDTFFQTFLGLPASERYKLDFADENAVTRYIVMSKQVDDSTKETSLMQAARDLASKYEDLNVDVFSPRMIFTEQYRAVLPNTLQNLGIAVGSMLIVSLFLIPHPFVSIFVVASIASIIVGVVGYMSLWQVNIDTISMVNLIMCIGFCVDFSAHITYAFVTSQETERSTRIKDALYTLGLPILQGAVSTILGVVVLAFSFAYIFRTFFKVMFLVILLGSLHGLFILPVFLSLIGPKGDDMCTKRNDISTPPNDIQIKKTRPLSAATETSLDMGSTANTQKDKEQ